jgi:cyanate permease
MLLMILCEHLGKHHRSIMNAFRKPTTPANKVGNLSGFTGPWFMGFSRDSTGSYTTGMVSLGLIIFTGGFMVWLLKFSQK